MKKYEPLQEPNLEEWLDIDEYERIDLVRRCHYYQNEDLPEDAKGILSLVHADIENRLAMKKMSLHRGLTPKYTFLENCPFSECR